MVFKSNKSNPQGLISEPTPQSSSNPAMCHVQTSDFHEGASEAHFITDHKDPTIRALGHRLALVGPSYRDGILPSHPPGAWMVMDL